MGPLGSTGFLINIQLISNSSQQGNEDLSDGETISQLYGNMHLSSHNSTTIIIQITKHQFPNGLTSKPGPVHACSYDSTFAVDIGSSMRLNPQFKRPSPVWDSNPPRVSFTVWDSNPHRCPPFPHVRHGWGSNPIEARIIGPTSQCLHV